MEDMSKKYDEGQVEGKTKNQEYLPQVTLMIPGEARMKITKIEGERRQG